MKTIVEIEPAFQQALLDAGLADFDALLRVRGGEPTSRHRHRETIPLEIAISGERRRFYLKRVFQVPLEHSVLPLLRAGRPYSQPMREWVMIRELERAGIPVVRRAAVGERRRLGRPLQAFLLVEAVPMEHTVGDWLLPGAHRPAVLSAKRRIRLMHAMGRLIGRIHRGGFLWPDIHSKHIFAREQSAGEPCRWDLMIIDVERMRRSSGQVADVVGSAPRAAFGDIFKLHRSTSPLVFDQSDYLAFWAGYFGRNRPLWRNSVWRRNQKVGLDFHWPSIAEHFIHHHLPDDYEHSRFNPLFKHAVGRVSARGRRWLQAEGVTRLDDVFSRPFGNARNKPGLSLHRDRRVLCVRDGNGSTMTLHLKRYQQPPFSEQLRRIRESRPRRSSAWREMHFAKVLSELGIPTMRRVAYGEAMRGWWEQRSFAITEQVPGESLEQVALRAIVDPATVPSPHDRHEIIRQLALITRLLHRHRLYHRDLYLSHVFFSRNADGGVVLHLIDLARMIEKPFLRARWVLKDLAALDYSAPIGLVTKADRLRFMRTYLGRVADEKRTLRYHLRRARERAGRVSRHDVRRMARLRSGANS